ncbi:class I SAM-dependent methyltransferase [Hoeflea sp. EC-HK425]|uniref:class I SAM-dependent methyltransferase n=1 Tax=Hoeflea sp. EC-HK425 TaxID=2038388 RepID=UPI001256AF5F|nr:class I SAM-dependent methyltransferase [Hoeflea sp. EC-HK425]VVT29351.1 Methylase involved in ubiquinone/menaquinone biosynthesis [Hoeflea sp. EC-HK425]
MTESLFHDPDFTRFYDIDNPWDTDKDYCLTLARDTKSVLDLGCGTGELATVLAKTRRVVGVEPAAAMLDHARRRQGAEHVRWVEADGRSVRLGETFDLVVMTGHAFQCLLTLEDQVALCETIATHLAPGGSFIFDSRNPAVEEWRKWTPDQTRRTIEVPDLGKVGAWNDARFEIRSGTVAYDTVYREARSGRQWQATSRLFFAEQPQIAAAVTAAGLKVHRWMGDWTGGSMTATSPEIIPVGGLAG